MSLTREEQTIWDAIADEAVAVIEDRERDGDRLRRKYGDVMSKGDFRNRDFESLVNLCFEAFPVIEDKYARDGDRLSDFLPKAIEDIVDGHFANSVLSNRELERDLDDRTYNEMQDAVDRYKDLVRGRGGRDRGYGRDDRGGRGRDRDDRGGTGYSRGGRGGRDDRNSRDIGREARNAGGGWRNRGSGQRASVGDGWVATAREAAAAQEVEVRQDAATPTPPPAAAAPAPAPVAPSRPALDGPDFTKARPYDDYWMKGEHWIVAHKSPWTLAWDDQNPLASVPKLYDIRTHVKYHVQSQDGKVREELIKMSQDARYLMHDQMAQPDRYQSTQPRAGHSVSLSGQKIEQGEDKLNDVPSKPKATYLHDVLNGIPLPQFNVDPQTGAPLAETLQGLVFNTRVKMFGNEDAQRLNVGFRTTALVASGWKQEELINQVGQSHNLAAAATKMNELKAEFDPVIWDTLNKRFSELTLRAVRFQFQHASVKALSFASDWQKLIDHLHTQKGEGFASDFAQRTSYIVAMACTLADRGDLPGFMDREGVEIPAVVFLDQIAMIAIEGSMDDLGFGNAIQKQETGVSITANADQELNAAVRHVYNKLDGNATSSGACRVYFNTSDGQLLELVPFAARKENFILVAVK